MVTSTCFGDGSQSRQTLPEFDSAQHCYLSWSRRPFCLACRLGALGRKYLSFAVTVWLHSAADSGHPGRPFCSDCGRSAALYQCMLTVIKRPLDSTTAGRAKIGDALWNSPYDGAPELSTPSAVPELHPWLASISPTDVDAQSTLAYLECASSGRVENCPALRPVSKSLTKRQSINAPRSAGRCCLFG